MSEIKEDLENSKDSQELVLGTVEKTEIESYFKMIVKRFKKHKLAVVSIVIIALLVFCAIFAGIISPQDPYRVTNDFSASPSPQHLLGTDKVGRDVLSRLIYASRVSLIVGIGAVSISAIIGITLGLISGYFGGWIDMIIMRFADIFMSFPQMLLIMVIVSIVGPKLTNIVFVLGFLGWPSIARLVRGSELSIIKADYVKSTIILGFKTPRIMFIHILPNIAAPILVNVTFGVANAIIMEASLSFLGLGVQPPIASWGNMLTDAQSISVLTSEPWLWVPPGLMIIISVLAVNFIGDGLRDALDPKSIR